MAHHPQEVVITTKNTTALTLGIISTVIGVLALLFGWVPFLGLLAIPIAVIGVVLAALGFIIALFTGFRGVGLPVLGGAICVIAVIIPLVSTGSASIAITETMEEVSHEMEQQREAREEKRAAPKGQQSQDSESSIVSVRLIRKEAKRENPLLDYYNLVFDVEFTGTDVLGERHIRDIKGTLYFDDAFGEEIIGATITKRLGIGSGQKVVVDGLMIDYTTVELSNKWKRILTTDAVELRVRFVVDRVIYQED